MKIYLAARYSRREELCGYRTQLEEMGHTITSRWLNGSHQISNEGKPIGETGEELVENGSCEVSKGLRESFAREDRDDVYASELVVAFTEVPRASTSRGGRHVELGLAIARGKIICLIGPRENIFCWLPDITALDSFEDLMSIMRAARYLHANPFLVAP